MSSVVPVDSTPTVLGYPTVSTRIIWDRWTYVDGSPVTTPPTITHLGTPYRAVALKATMFGTDTTANLALPTGDDTAGVWWAEVICTDDTDLLGNVTVKVSHALLPGGSLTIAVPIGDGSPLNIGDAMVVAPSAAGLIVIQGPQGSPGPTGPTGAIGPAGSTAMSAEQQLYVASRGPGLITNGSGWMGTNYNFPITTFSTADHPYGAAGMFMCPLGGPALVGQATESFQINPNLFYDLSLEVKQIGTATAAANKFYAGLAMFDNNALIATTLNWCYAPNTLTTLAAPLTNGQMTVQLTSSANWNNAAGATYYWRNLLFWDYTDAKGYLWPPLTYSRNAYLDAYADGGITGNTVTLRVPWAGGTKAAGTQISNGTGPPGNYFYMIVAQPTTSSWVRWKARMGGGVNLSGATSSFQVPPGVSQVKFVFLSNYVSGGEPLARMAFGNVSFVESTNEPIIPTGTSLQYVRGDKTVQTLDKTAAGLSLVDNVSDVNKPVSTAQNTAIVLRAPKDNPVFTGTVSGVTKTHVGLGNADNTSDVLKPLSTANTTALALKQDQITAGTTFQYYRGDKTWVVLDKTAVALDNVDNTADTAKPVSTAQVAANALLAPLASPAFTGTPTGITKTHVGLGSVDNTADTAKPVSTATTTALALKANIDADSGWIDVAAAATFTAMGTPEQFQVRKIGNRVYTRGGFTNTGMAASGAYTICTIPSGYRPVVNLGFAVGSAGGDSVATIIMTASTGTISMRLSSTLGAYYKFDGHVWLTD